MRSSKQKAPLLIGINGQILTNVGAGGVERIVTGLIHALGLQTDGSEEYLIIASPESHERLKPYMGPNQRFIPKPTGPTRKEKTAESFKESLGPLRSLLRKIWRPLFLPPLYRQYPEVPRSNGFFENLKLDVLHFPSQHYILSEIPSIYNPHDLQHFHYPEFFRHIGNRETVYPAGSRSAHTVVVTSHLVKQDLVRYYHLTPDKIKLIHWGPSTQLFPEPSPGDLSLVRTKYNLSEPFAFYPAMAWEHKNHIRLLEALALLRDRKGQKIHLTCIGHKHRFWPNIEKRLMELGLADQVNFLGMVPAEELRSFYRLAQFVVIPTLFEATSGVMREAWLDGVPVACSTATALPEQAGDGALLFDPLSVESIALAVSQMSTDSALRHRLQKNGSKRVLNYRWDTAARAYRAVYRRAAGAPLSDEDRYLLKLDKTW